MRELFSGNQAGGPLDRHEYTKSCHTLLSDSSSLTWRTRLTVHPHANQICVISLDPVDKLIEAVNRGKHVLSFIAHFLQIAIKTVI